MKLNLLLPFVCFCIVNAYSQSNNILSGPSSHGEFPINFNTYYIPNQEWKISLNNRSFQTNSSKDHLFAKQAIISSGFVLFGSVENTTLNNEFLPILNQLFPNEKKSILIYKSLIPAVFNVDSDLYVTTGLLANLQNESQLTYLLIRAAVASKHKQSTAVTKNFTCTNLDDLLLFHLYEDAQNTSAIDKEAFELCQKNSIQSVQITSSFHLLKHAHLPFHNNAIASNDFNNEWITIPTKLFEVSYSDEKSLRNKTANLVAIDNAFDERIKSLNLSAIEDVKLTTNKSFIDLIETMQVEKIKLNIATNNHSLAIYELFGLPNDNINKEHLIALAWLGIIDKEFGNITKNGINHFYGDLHKSAGFFNFFTIQNSYSRTAVAIRILKDLKVKNSSVAFDMYFDYAISILNKSSYFDSGVYSTQKAQEPELNSENEHLKKENLDFHKYAITDVMSDKILEKSELKVKNSAIEHKNIDVVIIKKRKYSSIKSNKINSKIQEKPVSFALNIAEYNEQENFGLLSFQANHNNKYSSGFIPVNYPCFQTKLNEKLMISYFDGYYRPHAKKSYFLALTVIGIPYVIGDLFIGGQSSWNTYYIFDQKTGIVEKCSQDFNRDYLTKPNITRRVNHTIINYEN